MIDLGIQTISVSYSQLVVFDHSLDRPFNGWTDRHVAQGFAWRPGSVAFRTVEEGGQHLVAVTFEVTEDDAVAPNALRVIDVPFEVPPDEMIEIGSVSDSASFKIPAGLYGLRFECFERSGGDTPLIRLSFRRSSSPGFRVIRAGPDFSPEAPLVLTASPA